MWIPSGDVANIWQECTYFMHSLQKTNSKKVLETAFYLLNYSTPSVPIIIVFHDGASEGNGAHEFVHFFQNAIGRISQQDKILSRDDIFILYSNATPKENVILPQNNWKQNFFGPTSRV